MTRAPMYQVDAFAERVFAGNPAAQLSPRRGRLVCRDEGDRVWIGGGAVVFLRGEIEF